VQDKVNQEESEQDEVNGTKKGPDAYIFLTTDLQTISNVIQHYDCTTDKINCHY